MRDNLRAAAVAAGRDPNTQIASVIAAFPALEPKLQAPGARLRGGQQQIVALARALVTQLRILLLDEPTEGIQPSVVHMILQKLQYINRNYRLAILWVEQNLEFAAELAYRAYIMNKGQIELELEPKEILDNLELRRGYSVIVRPPNDPTSCILPTARVRRLAPEPMSEN